MSFTTESVTKNLFVDGSSPLTWDNFLFSDVYDVNGDNLLDVIVGIGILDYQKFYPRLFIQTTSGAFEEQIIENPSDGLTHPRRIVSADFNGDGFTDIVIAGHGYDRSPFPGETSIYWQNTGQNTWVDKSDLLPDEAAFTHSLAVADLNDDGFSDLFMGNIWSSALTTPSLLLGASNGFNAADLPNSIGTEAFSVGYRPVSSLLTDLDGDEKEDLIIGSFSKGDVIFWGSSNSESDSQFNNQETILPAGVFGDGNSHTVDIESIDLNQDGLSDLILAQTPLDPFYEGGGIQLLIQQPDGNFIDETLSIIGKELRYETWPVNINLGHINDDLRIDFLISTQQSDYLYINNANGTFFEYSELPTSLGITFIESTQELVNVYINGTGLNESALFIDKISLNITDVNEAPAFASSTASATVAENSAVFNSVYTASASDMDGDTLVYSLSGTDYSSVTIDASTGALKLKASADYEAKDQYQFTVTASDGSLTDSLEVILDITDVDEEPAFASPVVSFVIAKTTGASTVVYTASASDVDGDTLAYSLSGTDASLLTIDSASGAVTLNAPADYETKNQYAFTVTASDGELTDTIGITLNVADVDQQITIGYVDSTSTTVVIQDQSIVLSIADANNVSVDVLNGMIGVLASTVSFDHIEMVSTSYDDGINISDAVSVLKHIVGLQTLTGVNVLAADANMDNAVNISDAVSVLKHIVGLDLIKNCSLVDISLSEITTLGPETIDDYTLIQRGDIDLSATFDIV